LYSSFARRKEWDRLPELAAELVALKVDVIVALYTPCALAAQTCGIVMFIRKRQSSRAGTKNG
jgi:hypothetical protein